MFALNNFKMADADELFDLACDPVVECVEVENLKDLQWKALKRLGNGEDVFVIQPTGSGKSLIYQSGIIDAGGLKDVKASKGPSSP